MAAKRMLSGTVFSEHHDFTSKASRRVFPNVMKANTNSIIIVPGTTARYGLPMTIYM